MTTRSKYWFCDHDLCLIRSYSIVTDTFAPGPLFLTHGKFVRIFDVDDGDDDDEIIIRQICTHLYHAVNESNGEQHKQQQQRQWHRKNVSDNECSLNNEILAKESRRDRVIEVKRKEEGRKAN